MVIVSRATFPEKITSGAAIYNPLLHIMNHAHMHTHSLSFLQLQKVHESQSALPNLQLYLLSTT